MGGQKVGTISQWPFLHCGIGMGVRRLIDADDYLLLSEAHHLLLSISVRQLVLLHIQSRKRDCASPTIPKNSQSIYVQIMCCRVSHNLSLWNRLAHIKTIPPLSVHLSKAFPVVGIAVRQLLLWSPQGKFSFERDSSWQDFLFSVFVAPIQGLLWSSICH